MLFICGLTKLNKIPKKLQHNCLKICALNYSRRSDSKGSDSIFKVVKSKVRLQDDSGWKEGGPNWEIFAPKGNRFYFPGNLGPAWQNSTSVIGIETNLENLVDFESKDLEKLHITTRLCPVLLRKNLHELFPAPEVVSNSNLTLITLSSQSIDEIEHGAKNFVLAAREICSRLRLNGYWADFMNPFSGKPFHSYSSGKRLYKIDQRFRGLGIKMEKHNECMIISSDDHVSFSGSVFTNAPSNLPVLLTLIME